MAAIKMPDLNPSSYRLLTDSLTPQQQAAGSTPITVCFKLGMNTYIYIYFYTYTLSWQGGFHFFQI